MTAWTRQRIVAAIVTAAVILLLSRDDIGSSWWWVVPMVVLTTVGLAGAVPTAHAVSPPGLLPGLFVGSAAAMYACVPETDPIPWVAFVSAILVVIEVARRRRIGPSWAIGVAHLIWWAGVYGATGRESAYVGAWFAWWPVFVLATFAPWAARLRRPPWITLTVAMLPVVAATGIVARTGALEATIGPALAAVALAAPASTAIAAVLLLALRDRRAQRAG